MSRSPRPAAPTKITRWLPLLERLEAREVPAAGLSNIATWSELGPNAISEGQTRGLSATGPNGGTLSNPVIGAVQALAPHPTNPAIMFAAGVNGGVWRTTNANVAAPAQPTWLPISDQLASLSISDLAINPDNPDQLLAGIGGTADGADVDGSGVVRGELVGVLYTTNATSATPTWTILSNNLANKNVTNVYLRSATGVAPNINPAYMLVATDAGLFRSNDGGLNFTNSFTATTNNGVTFFPRTFGEGVFDLIENPRLRNQFYVATKATGGVNGLPQIWRTDDGGLTWGTVTDTTQMQLNARTVNVQLSVRDAGASDNQVYVAVSNDTPAVGTSEVATPGVGFQYAWESRDAVVTSVCWSTNQGGNWTRMDAPRGLTASSAAVATNDTSTGDVTIDTGLLLHRLMDGDKVRLSGRMRQILTFADPSAMPPTQETYGDDIGPTTTGAYYLVDVTGPTTFVLRNFTLTGGTGTFENGNWQRVVGANPGEKGQFLQLAASQTAENLVYLGGDESQFNFGSSTTTSTTPTTFTGTYWTGNRFNDPLSGNEGGSSQWATLTDSGTNSNANGRTAPGADSRDMVFDANGALWVATGSGVFRRTNLAGSGNWVPESGNLRVGQFWSVSLDTLTQTAVGAMQDTGQTEQNFNSLGWKSLLVTGGTNANSDRNLLFDQESAYSTFVDNSNPTFSARYTLGSDFRNVTRRTYNSSGTQLSSSQLEFNPPSDPNGLNGPFGGISGTDLAASASGSNAGIVLQLNANDTRRGVYGLNSLYEDSDPNGNTGKVVNEVLSPGALTGRVRAMAYGGKRAGTSFNQILVVGTETGQVLVRGEFGTTFTSRPTGGTGSVTDIELDPDDWRHMYVLQGNKVFETTDAGVTFADVSANLSTAADAATGLPSGTGLTTQVRTIALYDPNPGTADVGTAQDVVLLAGGRGGVFRRTLSACGTSTVWAEYGTGLPNTVVQDLKVYGNQLLAGTFGRGAWVVNDVSPTLNTKLYLDVVGDGNANTIIIEADPLDPNGVFVTDGTGAPRQRFVFGQFDEIRITAGAGADTVLIDSNGLASGGSTKFVSYPISVNMGGDVGDVLSVNDASDTANVQATITATAVGYNFSGDSLFNSCGSLTYTGLQNGSLTVNTGSGNDKFIVDTTVLPTTFLNGGTGNDTYLFTSTTTGNVGIGDLGGVDLVTVFGAATPESFLSSGTDIRVNSLNVQFDNAINVAQVRGNGGADQLVWSGTAGQDLVAVRKTDPAATPNSTDLQDLNLVRPTFRFDGIAEATLNLGAAADAAYIDSNGVGLANPGGDVNFVNYVLNVNLGGDQDDQLLVNDAGDTAATRATLTGTSVGANPGNDNLFGTGGYVTYSGLNRGRLFLMGGSGDDNYLILGGSPLPALSQIDAGSGNDNYIFDGSATGYVLLNDSAGTNDYMQVNVPAGQTAAVDFANNKLDTGGLTVQYDIAIEDLFLNGLGSGAAVAWSTNGGNDTVYLMQDPSAPSTNSQILTSGRAVRFRNMNAVSVNTGAGRDVFQIDSNGPAADGDAAFVKYVVTGILGGDANDSLVINDGGKTADTALNVTPTTVGAAGGNNLFGTNGYLIYSGLVAGSLSLYTGTGNDSHFFEAGPLPLVTNVFSGAGNDLFQLSAGANGVVNVSDTLGADETKIFGTAGGDAVGITGTTVAANSLLVQNSGVEQFTVSGNGGFDTLTDQGTAAADTFIVRQTAALSGTLVGFPVAARYDGVEFVGVDGLGGTNSLTWEDQTAAPYGNTADPLGGIVFAPSGAAGGDLRVSRGAVTTTRLTNVNGTFRVNGNPNGNSGGTDTRDALTVLGLSSTAAGSADGEAVATNGSDTVTVTDTGVTMTNATLGSLRGITFGTQPDGTSSFGTVLVKGGNEVGGTGDTFTATTTLRSTLLLDGGTPTGTAPGDTLTVITTGRAFSTPNSPAPYTRITDRTDTSSLSHRNFEGVTANFVSGGVTNPSLQPPPARIFAAATDAGSTTQVRVYNTNGTPRFGTITPFPGFSGGASVAVGDVTGDDFPDVIVGAGAGGGPAVKVYNGATGALVRTFFAFNPVFSGGVNVSVGYSNADGFADIIVGAGAGGGPNVKVFDGRSVATGSGSTAPTALADFQAFDAAFTGGVRVAGGDLDGDADADIVVGMQSGGDQVRAYRTGDGAMIADFSGVGGTTSGVNVAAGDITGDGRADFIVGAGPGSSTRVVIYGSDGSGLIRDFVVNDPTIPGTPPIPVTSGVRVSTADLDGDGLADVVTGRGKGSKPFVRFLKVSTKNADGSVSSTLPNNLSSLLDVNTFGDGYSDGIFVGG